MENKTTDGIRVNFQKQKHNFYLTHILPSGTYKIKKKKTKNKLNMTTLWYRNYHHNPFKKTIQSRNVYTTHM